MNNTRHTLSDRVHLDTVTELLKGLEGEKPIAEVLMSAEKLFVKDVSDKLVIKARQRIAVLKQRYGQGDMKEDEAKAEISNILIMLT